MTLESGPSDFHKMTLTVKKVFYKKQKATVITYRSCKAHFINKTINTEIIKRSQLRNIFLNAKNDIDRKAYNKQLNFCVSLFRWERKNFCNNIGINAITDNNTFWKTVKLLSTDKVQTKSKITLIEKRLFLEEGKSKEFLEKWFQQIRW